MAGLPKRALGSRGDKLQADANRALADLEGQIDAYTPANPAHWADPPPTSAREAWDRLAAAIATLHPGSEP